MSAEARERIKEAARLAETGAWIVRVICATRSFRHPIYTFTVYGHAEGEAVDLALSKVRSINLDGEKREPIAYTATPAAPGIVAHDVSSLSQREFQNIYPETTLILTAKETVA